MNPDKSIIGYCLFYIPHKETEEEIYKLLVLDDSLEYIEKEKERLWEVWKIIHPVPDNFIILELNQRQYDKCKFIEDYDLDLITVENDTDIYFRSNVILNTLIKDYLLKEHKEFMEFAL